MAEERKIDWRNFTRLCACAYLFVILMVFIKTKAEFTLDNFVGKFFISPYLQTFNWIASISVISFFNFKKPMYN